MLSVTDFHPSGSKNQTQGGGSQKHKTALRLAEPLLIHCSESPRSAPAGSASGTGGGTKESQTPPPPQPPQPGQGTTPGVHHPGELCWPATGVVTGSGFLHQSQVVNFGLAMKVKWLVLAILWCSSNKNLDVNVDIWRSQTIGL